MKIVRYTILSSSLLFFLACSGGNSQDKKEDDPKGDEKGNKKEEKAEKKDRSGVTKRGATFDPKGAFAAAKLPKKMEGKDSMQVKIQGKVQEVCQKKGCWMTIDMGEEHPKLRVRFKDYGFFVPKDAGGSHAMMKGWAYQDTMSVKMRRHYAKDEGKSQEAIDSIQDPKPTLAFKASGVLLKDEKEKK